MLPTNFIKKHRIDLAANELELCRQAMDKMATSADAHHDETHVFRMLDYLDDFIGTPEFEQRCLEKINLKVLFIAILWHDVWRTEKEPASIWALVWSSFWEGIAAGEKFHRAARQAGLEGVLARKARYAIRKHAIVQILPLRTLEAKILADMDNLDCMSLDRVYPIEKRYLCEESASVITLWVARAAVWIFVETKSEKSFYFDWARKNGLRMRQIFLNKARVELEEYARLVKIARSNQVESLESQLCFLRDKYITRSEEKERYRDPF